ncbi:hypothetical protein TNCV_1486061 [Trichonephila clavipes]|nr:hypothetical protein TNCV_1486061 [Trichonephila clavipes]
MYAPAVASSTIQVTVRFSSLASQFSGKTPCRGQGPPTPFFLPPTSRENLQHDGYLEYPRATKALCIYKHPYLHRDSSLAVSVANHYTGWATTY